VRTLDLGGQPDSIAISKDGRYGAIAMENQRDEDVNDGEIPQLPGGFLNVVDFVGSPGSWSTRAVSLTGLSDIAPEDPEPEYVDINDENIAVVTLQENNHIVLVDLRKGKVVKDFSAGTVDLKKIDTVDDNPSFISLTGSASGLKREPDGVAWISSGPFSSQFAVTNEGDLDGGSRSFSIFDSWGRVKFESGNALDHLAVRHGHYPDGRSDAKGNEPENVKFAKYGDAEYLFVASERSSVVFVYEIGRNGQPTYKQTLPAGVGPEGLLAIPSRGLFVAASEEDGFDGTSREEVYRAGLSIYRLERGEPKYPTVVSANRPDHTPIPWGALSDLAISSSGKAYTLPDSVFAQTRIFEMTLNKSGPAVISREIVLKDAKGLVKAVAPSRVNADGTVNLDGEGLSLSATGGFWIASEGTTAADFPNLLIKATANGDITKVVSLPAATHARRTSNGFEGVIEEGRYVYVAFQREWSGDTQRHVRIGRYDTVSGEWTFVYYPIEAPSSPNGGWVGLSALTSLGRGDFAVIERDNQAGTEARIKRIYKFSLSNVTWRPESSTPGFAVVTKKLVRDLMGDLEATGGAVIEKIEGLAADRFGTLYVLSDNDGVDGSNGETQLFTVKPGTVAQK
jgi:hypothetical protein